MVKSDIRKIKLMLAVKSGRARQSANLRSASPGGVIQTARHDVPIRGAAQGEAAAAAGDTSEELEAPRAQLEVPEGRRWEILLEG
jgi:hypothetical protein